MRNCKWVGLAAVVLACASVFGEPVRVGGRIEGVTVYRGQAQVTRVVDLKGKAGVQEIVVTDLPPKTVASSLVAEGEGIEVRSVLYRQRAAESDIRADVRELDVQIEAKGFELQDISRQQKVLADHTAYLGKLENFAAPTATTELTKGVLNADTLAKLTQFLLSERQRVAAEELKLSKAQKATTEAVELLQRKRAELASSSARTLREAVVLVDLKGGGSTLKLQYLVSDATWTPSYTVRDGGGEKDADIALSYNASIIQQSGEDWSEVAMRLSTATPALVALAPQLEPLMLSLSSEAREGIKLGDYDRAKSELTSRQRSLEQARNSAPAAGAMAAKAERDLNEVASQLQVLDLLAKDTELKKTGGGWGEPARSEEIAVTYELPAKTTLPSRSDTQLVQIAALALPAQRVKVATPLLTPYVYEQAEIRNTSALVLLAGEVTSFTRGQFVGRGTLATVSPGQSFTAGLGIDPSLKASRELLERRETQSGGNKVVTFSYRLRLENFAGTPANVRLLDRLPTTKESPTGNQPATVTMVSMTTPQTSDPGHAAAAKQGMLRWDLTVPANATGPNAAEVTYVYRLEHDRQMSLTAGAQ